MTRTRTRTKIFSSSLPNQASHCHHSLYIYISSLLNQASNWHQPLYIFQVYSTKHLTVINLFIYISSLLNQTSHCHQPLYIYFKFTQPWDAQNYKKLSQKCFNFHKIRRKFFIWFFVDFKVSINFIYSIFLRKITLKSLIKLFYHDIFQNFFS